MKKLSIAAFAFVAALGSFAPMTTEAANYQYIKSMNLQEAQAIYNSNSNRYNSLKEFCDDQNYYIINGNLEDCPDFNTSDYCPPETITEAPQPETPSVPEAPQPETPAPETPQPETPAPETPQPETPGETGNESSYEMQVLKLVNAERKKAGLNELSLNQNAEKAAKVRAKEIVSSFSHTRPNGTSFSTALTESGTKFKGTGENIAWGQTSPEKVMEAWMNSAGHRANILNKNFTSMGVGHYQNASGTNYWTQLFVY